MVSVLFVIALLSMWAKTMAFAHRRASEPAPGLHSWMETERGWSQVPSVRCRRCGISSLRSEMARLPDGCDDTARYLAVEKVMES